MKFDLEIVLQKLAGNDKKALEELFNYYYPRLYNFSKSFLKLEEGIDDILQDVFIKIWNNRTTIHNSATFNPFIFTITRNLLLNELRKRLNNQKLKDKVQKLAVAEEFNTFEKIEYSELREIVDEIIQKLPDKQKQVFILSRNQGLSYKEISEKLNISVKTVEYHIAQSTSSIKSKLKQLGVISLLYFYLFL